jgi:hypothetical protein
VKVGRSTGRASSRTNSRRGSNGGLRYPSGGRRASGGSSPGHRGERYHALERAVGRLAADGSLAFHVLGLLALASDMDAPVLDRDLQVLFRFDSRELPPACFAWLCQAIPDPGTRRSTTVGSSSRLETVPPAEFENAYYRKEAQGNLLRELGVRLGAWLTSGWSATMGRPTRHLVLVLSLPGRAKRMASKKVAKKLPEGREDVRVHRIQGTSRKALTSVFADTSLQPAVSETRRLP